MDKTILELTNIGALQSGDVLPLAREGVIQDNCTTVGAINTFVEGQADDEPTEESTQLVKSGGVFLWVANLIATIKEWVANHFARQDGYYSQMTVGSAENLVGQTVDSEAYLIRPTAGAENEVANGVASVLGMEGNSCVWNQTWSVENGSYSPTTTDTRGTCNIGIREFDSVSSGSIVKTTNWFTAQLTDINIEHTTIITCTSSTNAIRLFHNGSSRDIVFPTIIAAPSHKIFISFVLNSANVQTGISCSQMKAFDLTLLGIDNLTTEAEVEAWLAQHVGTKPYYAYNAGTILSAKTLGIKTYGQNLLNPTTKQAKLIPYTWVENGVTYSNQYTIKNVPSGATATFTPDNTGVAETVDISGGSLDITSYGSGILELSSATTNTYVCMKWNTEKDNDVVPYEDPHTYDFDVRKVYGENNSVEYQCYPNGMRSAGSVHDTLSASEAVVKIGSRAYQSGDESDSSVITDGTNTLYALSTPITYTDLIYRDGGIDRPLADVLMYIEVNNWSMEEQLMTDYVDGNPTSIPATISTRYGMDAVEQIDTLNKTCYFADDVKANLQALLTCINTNCAETLGGTFSIGDPTQEDSKVFTFTFTANTEPDVEQNNE